MLIALRADDDIDRLLAAQHEFALGLGDAAGDDDLEIAPGFRALALEHGQLAEFGIDFFRRPFADMAGVEDDEIGVFFARGLAVTLSREKIGHARGVIDIHLAAERLHQNFSARGGLPRGALVGAGRNECRCGVANFKGSLVSWPRRS